MVIAAVLLGAGVAYAETAAGTVVVQDTFSRSVSGGWGSATQGGAYRLGPDATQFKVSNGVGTFPSISSGKSANAVLTGTSIRDTDMQSTFSLPRHTLVRSVLRRLCPWAGPTDRSTRGRVSIGAGGKATVSFSRTKGSAETYLGSAALPFLVAANQKVTIRLQAVGTSSVTLKVKAWVSGGAQSRNWQVEHVDSSACPHPSRRHCGFVGIRFLRRRSVHGTRSSRCRQMMLTGYRYSARANPRSGAYAYAYTFTQAGRGTEPGRRRSVCCRGARNMRFPPVGCVRGDERFRRCERLVGRSAAHHCNNNQQGPVGTDHRGACGLLPRDVDDPREQETHHPVLPRRGRLLRWQFQGQRVDEERRGMGGIELDEEI